MTKTKRQNWNDISEDDAYKLSISEFKGATLNALQYINKSIEDLQKGQDKLQDQINNQKLIATVIGGFSGVIAALLSPFKRV